MAKIVTVYNTERRITEIGDMSYIRWFKISSELAALGHHVDMATAEHKGKLWKPVIQMGPRLRRVPVTRVQWDEYDVVKVLFHQGFETLRRFGGSRHPFIVTKLGSVVANTDREGILFYGKIRESLYRTQEAIAGASRYVTVLTEPAADLWAEMFGNRERILLVPGAVDAKLPTAGRDPFPDDDRPRCLFAGNIYLRSSQPEANRVLVEKLNDLGRLLHARGATLYLLGDGRVADLDRRYVHHLGSVRYEDSWDYLRHADVGVLLSAGPFMHNNESTKIYHYLRVGLPVVSEAGFPNDDVLLKSGIGTIVPNGDLPTMAEKVAGALDRKWDRDGARTYISNSHTWTARVRVYDELFAKHFGEQA